MDFDPDLEQSFAAHRPRLLRFLVARGAGDEAEDLLQDLWLRLTRVEPSPAMHGLGYMMRAADRLMIDRFRSRRQATLREQAWSEAQPGMSEEAPAPTAERIVAAGQELELIEQTLTNLGERPATIFRRHRIDGMAQRAIAEELGVSISTVESDLRRVYAALVDLRSTLDEG